MLFLVRPHIQTTGKDLSWLTLRGWYNGIHCGSGIVAVRGGSSHGGDGVDGNHVGGRGTGESDNVGKSHGELLVLRRVLESGCVVLCCGSCVQDVG